MFKLLEVKNLYKAYRKALAVNNVSFNIKPGQVSLLLGPNGAGKSTIIKSISGLIKYNGEIIIDGLKNTSIEARKIFSYVSEIPYPFEYLTVREHLEFVSRAYGIKSNNDEIENYLEAFDLGDKQNKLGKELSKGMKQKLSIICGLISNPKYVLFDEPLIGLDPKAIRECKNIFIKLKNSGCGVLISTHIIDTLEDIWDEAIILQKGSVKLQSSRAGIQNKRLEEVFFEITEGDPE